MFELISKIASVLGLSSIADKLTSAKQDDTEAVKIAKIEAETEDKKRNKYIIALKWICIFVICWNFIVVPIVGIWYALPVLPIAEIAKAIMTLAIGS